MSEADCGENLQSDFLPGERREQSSNADLRLSWSLLSLCGVHGLSAVGHKGLQVDCVRRTYMATADSNLLDHVLRPSRVAAVQMELKFVTAQSGGKRTE